MLMREIASKRLLHQGNGQAVAQQQAQFTVPVERGRAQVLAADEERGPPSATMALA
jgi:hypothetical protein